VTDFRLPELGENVTAGDVLRVLVKPGDTLTKDQPVLELETDKATIEVPSSVAGQIKDVKVKAGDKVTVGQTILSVEEGSASAPAPAPAKEAPAAKAKEEGPAAKAKEEPAAAKAEKKEERPSPKAQQSGDKVVDFSRGSRSPAEPATPELPVAPAAPSVRRMARELGIDIDRVGGSGASGRISVEDVKAQARRQVTSAAGKGAPVAGEPLPDFSRWGDVERQAMKAVRRKTAEHLSFAWATIPHVTQHDVADITSLEELRKRYAKKAEAAGGALTVTAIAVKIVAAALKVFPQVNASIDMDAGEIIYKKYVNIGVAVDTDRGLLVPVIRNADSKNIVELSVELAQLSEKARNRKISLEEMQGGCFSISNLGGIGGTSFTPIVNAPEIAILGISRGRIEPVLKDGAFVPRLMLPLSLSYDHRAIDGADGARFLRWIVDAFEQPFLVALQG
jgi:pyruvate dehydrogenase E2 component (dihydrolipoamide acetyltransferase)